MTLAIETRQLRKEYKQRAVVRSLDLEVSQGEVFGFLGPNGAGKSTTVKMLLGLVKPSSGTVRVLGGSVESPQVRRQLGFLPEQFRFHTWMTGNEFLAFHGRLAGLSRRAVRERAPEALKLVGLEGRGRDELRGYSKGMLQRIGIAQALIHGPKLIFLDEPTSALDPLGRVEVRNIIHSLKDSGVTVFLNSHLLSEVEQTCDRVAFVNQGQMLQAGTLRELLGPALTLDVQADRLTPEVMAKLRKLGAVAALGEGRARLELADEHHAPRVAELVVGSGARLYALTPHKPDLEDLFVRLIEKGGDR
ncbi:ABC transporter ATP-binding protein [Deinococcus peraridilitoris]|uniref:ABC-type multidrug transport system, ATPase component n=1 Tax=Deinococcus peraridilitoris (strain DSM 19664 / LMG 22246 / CIP 109416 / KR-200) TaxID=937777 RepID=K9ZY68_DEIPD|nr:ABC transporter ATP-binding protein [Deinococcus peraridilitoris]AFZ66124.1 ABC-type multidrug transport system, ATPase component [Deinococcus peraridilitoris DSM 19664]